MTGPATAKASSHSLADWRIIPRIAAMIGWLILCVPAYYLSRVFVRRSPVPPIFLSGIARIAGVRIRSRGSRAVGRRIILSNHVSWLDIPILARTARAAFVAHDGLAEHSALKWLCDMNDTVFIARSQRQTVGAQVEQIRAALDQSPTLVLFAEGTTANGLEMLPLKSSLLSAIDPVPEDVAVQPVLLDYGPEADRIAWVGAEPGMRNFMKIIARGQPITVTAHFLPPLSNAALDGRKAIARAAQVALEDALAKAHTASNS